MGRKVKMPFAEPPSSGLLTPTGLAMLVAGVVAFIGVTSLRNKSENDASRATKRTAKGTAPARKSNAHQVRVGLLQVHVPQNFRDLVKNDVLLEKSVENVSTTLIIYVQGRDKHEILNYMSELYGVVWDTACLFQKELLDIRIVGNLPETAANQGSWEELLLLPELNAVFGEDSLLDVQRLNAQRPEQDGLFPVTFHPLTCHIEQRLHPELHYFEDQDTNLAPHDTVILGGTFDHLHNGHKKLLSLAVSICRRRLIVGVTSAAMLTNKSDGDLIETIDERKSKVAAFLRFLNDRLQYEIVTIEDPFGPAITVPEPAALVVSTETIRGAFKINEIRVEKELPRLQLFVCRRTEANTLSSSYIRQCIAKGAC